MFTKNMKKLFLSIDHKKQKFILNTLSYIPIVQKYPPLAHMRWVREEYTSFGQQERQRIFLSIARFAHINRPINGYYMEFGCNEGNTMRKAWDTFKYLFDWEYLAFDSFEGLPEMEDSDRSEIFYAGNLKTDEDIFIDIVTKHGMPRTKLKTIKGFYEDSLNDTCKKELQDKKAAVIYIDCDLYASTVPVLNFIKDFLQVGTIIVFDDWNCYKACPDHGERRAWSEFLHENANLDFQEFIQTAEAKAFICTSAQ